MKEDTNKKVNSVLRDLVNYYEELFSLPEDSPIRDRELALANSELSYMPPVDVRLVTDKYYAAIADDIQSLVDRIKEIYRREFGLEVTVFFSIIGVYALRIVFVTEDGNQHDNIIAPARNDDGVFTILTLLEMSEDIRDELFAVALKLVYLLRDVDSIAVFAGKMLASGCPASDISTAFTNAATSFINDIKARNDSAFHGFKVKIDPSSYTVYVYPEDVELFGPGTIALKTTYTQFLNPSNDAEDTFERLKNVEPSLHDYLHKETDAYCGEHSNIANSVKKQEDNNAEHGN